MDVMDAYGKIMEVYSEAMEMNKEVKKRYIVQLCVATADKLNKTYFKYRNIYKI